ASAKFLACRFESKKRNVALKNVRGNRYSPYFVVKQLGQTFPYHLDQNRFSSYGVACPVSTLDRLVTIASYATRKPSDSPVGLRIRGLQHNAIQQSSLSEGLLMVLTAVVGTVAGGTMLSSYVNVGKVGPSFLLTVNPSTLSIEQGSSLTSTVSIISVNAYSETVSLSLFFAGAKLPASVSPTSVSVPANGTAKSTLTVTATSSIGNYNIVVIGIASSHGKTTYASADLSVQVVSNQDFTITSSPSNI